MALYFRQQKLIRYLSFWINFAVENVEKKEDIVCFAYFTKVFFLIWCWMCHPQTFNLFSCSSNTAFVPRAHFTEKNCDCDYDEVKGNGYSKHRKIFPIQKSFTMISGECARARVHSLRTNSMHSSIYYSFSSLPLNFNKKKINKRVLNNEIARLFGVGQKRMLSVCNRKESAENGKRDAMRQAESIQIKEVNLKRIFNCVSVRNLIIEINDKFVVYKWFNELFSLRLASSIHTKNVCVREKGLYRIHRKHIRTDFF